MAQLESLQFHDPAVMLDEGRIGSHGKLVHSLQIVIENAQGWNETRHEGTRHDCTRLEVEGMAAGSNRIVE